MDKLNIPGYVTYYCHIGDRISISIKPIDKKGPLITLDEKGRWINKIRRSFYQIDEDGARFCHTAKKGSDLDSYVPDGKLFVDDNALATKKERMGRR